MVTLHTRALSLEYANLELHALQHRQVFVGSAGSVIERTNTSGFRFYVHQFYGAGRKQRERYLAGPVGNAEADAKARAIRDEIRELKSFVPSLRLLGRERFAMADRDAYAAIATLHNAGMYAAGAMLAGPCAYGAIANRMGARVDVPERRRSEGIAFRALPERGLLARVREAGAMFRIEVLVPSRSDTFEAIVIPDSNVRAVAVPYLAYLLAAEQTGMVIAREGLCPVRLPLPERFVVHALVTATLHGGRDASAGFAQAIALSAAVAELFPGAIADAVRALPKRARKHFAKGRARVKKALEVKAPRAWEELQG